MLDRAKAFAFRQSDIVGGNVVLKIDERLVSADIPERRNSRSLIVYARQRLGRRCKASVLGGLPACRAAVGGTIAPQQAAACGADRDGAWWRLPRHKSRQIGVPSRPAAVVTGQAE